MRILFTTQPLPSHYFPLQPIASAAMVAGHDVAFAAAPGLGELIRGAGCLHFAAGIEADAPEVIAVLHEAHTSVPEAARSKFIFEHFFGGILSDRLLPDLTRSVDEFQPELIVSEITEMLGPLLAEARGIPATIVHFGIVWSETMKSRTLRHGFLRLRPRLGLDTSQPLHAYDRALKLVFATREYQLDAEIPPNATFFRPHPFEGFRVASPGWLAAPSRRPIVYATLGTVPEFNTRPGALRTIVDALAACDVEGVVTTGRNQDPAALGPRPSNVRIERFIPQSAVLPHCRAVIAHGGYGTTIGALSFGVPLVLTPLASDQFMHAERCEKLGVALVLRPGDVTVASLVAALERVLSEPDYAQRARQQSAQLSALPDLNAAVAALEAHVSARAL